MVDSFRAHLPRLPRPAPRGRALRHRAATPSAAALAAWLDARPEVRAVLPIRVERAAPRRRPVEVYGFRDDATYRDNWPLLAAAPDAWDRVASGEAVLVNEQLARRAGLALGDASPCPTDAGPWPTPVPAIYGDYGNTVGQVDGLPRRPSPRACARPSTAGMASAPRPRRSRRSSPTSAPPSATASRVVDQRGLKAISRAHLRADLRRHRRAQRPDPRRRRLRAPDVAPHARLRPPRPARPGLGAGHPPPPRPARARRAPWASPRSPRSPRSPSASRSPGSCSRWSTSRPSAGASRSSSSPRTGSRLFLLALAAAALAALWPALRLAPRHPARPPARL